MDRCLGSGRHAIIQGVTPFQRPPRRCTLAAGPPAHRALCRTSDAPGGPRAGRPHPVRARGARCWPNCSALARSAMPALRGAKRAARVQRGLTKRKASRRGSRPWVARPNGDQSSAARPERAKDTQIPKICLSIGPRAGRTHRLHAAAAHGREQPREAASRRSRRNAKSLVGQRSLPGRDASRDRPENHWTRRHLRAERRTSDTGKIRAYDTVNNRRRRTSCSSTVRFPTRLSEAGSW